MKKIAYFTKHQNKGASSRYRSVQYFDFLRSKGYSVTQYPFFDDVYLERQYDKKSVKAKVVFYFMRRFFLSITYLFKKDVRIVVEKEFIPYFPPIIEWFYHTLDKDYLLDYDDAVWHSYDTHRLYLIRFLLSRKHSKIIRWSTGVTAGSHYIYDYANAAGAPSVELIPTVVDMEKYKVTLKKQINKFVIGWIGSPSTTKYLKLIDNAVNKLQYDFKELDIELKVIGADHDSSRQLKSNVKIVKWNENTEVEEMSTFTIGVMPLRDSLFEKGKCSFKLIQYMALGLPVACSPVGENKYVVNNGVNGFYCITDEDWYLAFKKIINSEQYNFSINKKKIEDYYSLQSVARKYFSYLENTFVSVK